MMLLILRFVVGGVAVCFFSALADGLYPKSFAGLFSAAPSVALSSLAMTYYWDGSGYAITEARSMIIGGMAFTVYAVSCAHLLARRRWQALQACTLALIIWCLCAFALKYLFLS
jgi:Protein of unknown function (DUF3147)